MRYVYDDGSGIPAPLNTWMPGEMIPYLTKNKDSPVGVEIGNDYGISTEYILDKMPTLKLFGVDPYIDYVDWNTNLLNDRQKAYEEMMARLNRFGDRFTHYRMTSDEAASKFQDESLDFVFIDGLHTYDQVLVDCRNYYPKVKKGALFCGHDFGVIEEVRNAVIKFAEEINFSGIQLTRQDVWYWYKP